MAETGKSLSPPPIKTPMLGLGGYVSQAWALFFQKQYDRSGGGSSDSLADANAKVKQLRTDVDALDGEVESLQSDATGLQSGLANAQNSITNLQTNVAGLSTSIAALAATVNGTADRGAVASNADGSYFEWTDGLMEAWGLSSSNSATGVARSAFWVPFPVVFDAPPTVMCQPVDNPDSYGTAVFACYPTGITTSGFYANIAAGVTIGGSGPANIIYPIRVNFFARGF